LTIAATTGPVLAFGPSNDLLAYAEALTRYFLGHPLSSSLPRKFKIAFEGCPDDHAMTAIHDLGWLARIEPHHGRLTRGFKLVVGGGTSILPTSAKALFDFLPAEDMLDVTEAIVRVYHKLGDLDAASATLEKYLQLEPEDEDLEVLNRLLKAMKSHRSV